MLRKFIIATTVGIPVLAALVIIGSMLFAHADRSPAGVARRELELAKEAIRKRHA